MSMSDFMPLIAMVIVQLGFAGMNIISKLAMESGMKPLVLVAYRQIFATIATIPFAYFLERRSRPRISLWIIFQIFLCSLTGATLNQVLYFVGLEKTTPTIACALSNILPAVTFVLAAISRQEKVGVKKIGGQAKIIGTLVCVCGAMLLSFYHGKLIDMGQSNIHWAYADKMMKRDSGPSGGDGSLMGPLLVMASSIAWAVWFILQAGLSRSFPAPYTTTALMCFMATIQCSAIALVPHHTISDWSLNSPISLISAIYAGVVCNALAFCLMSWSIERKGALYVSVFSPLLLVMVAILSWALLHEKLYVGTAAGSMMIIAGLYAVLWGKDREINNEGERGREGISKTENESSYHHQQHQHKEFDASDLELQFPPSVLLTNPNY